MLLAAAAAIAPLSPAFAQQRPAPPAAQQPARPPAPTQGRAPPTVGEVTVTGQGQEVRTSVDRRSYSVTGDLQATTGSIGDALRNIPSVDVDVQGNLSLRGDPNVTIMIDGKPSAMFSGEGRADALQRIPADQIERVEVMTNPSAAFNPEGTAGVINLVTKKARGVGASGTVRAQYGSHGRYMASGSVGYNSKKLSLSGDLGYRHDKNHGHLEDTRSRTDAATGHTIFQSTQVGDFYGAGDFWNGSAGVDYDLDDKNRLSGRANFFDQDFANRQYNRFTGTSIAGPVGFHRVGGATSLFNNKEVSGSWRRKFSGEEHELVADTSFERGVFRGHRFYQTFGRAGGLPDLFEDLNGRFVQQQTELKIDYKRPLPDEAKLNLGYNLQYDDNDYDNTGSRGPSPTALTPDVQLINHFLFEQQIHAFYGTYERPFGEVTAKLGLRLEQVLVDLTQVTIGRQDENDYFRAYPSVHLGYKLSDAQQLTFAYSKRIQRPQPQELNPFRFYQDEFTFREGNPGLEPAETDSFELGYQYRRAQTFYLATLYYRARENEATDVIYDLGGGAFLSRRENLGSSRNGGLELVANGRLNPKLSYNVSANVFWAEIEARNLGFASTRSGASVSGRANLNWQVTAKDFVQFNLFANGKQLLPQGYREGTGMLNIGYRHKFTEKLSATVMAQDVLDTFKFNLVLDTPTLKQRIEQRQSQRGVFVGLSYAFGGPSRRRQPEGFDFGGPAPAGPQ
jgi:outer membrane receptor protein involved in Fe transport